MNSFFPGNCLWTKKYKPKSIQDMIGSADYNNSAKKLLNWLRNWHTSSSKSKSTTTGNGFKAVLISGPPGVGKSMCSQLACKEAGFSCIEFNASDTRSSKLFNRVLGECSTSQTISFQSKEINKQKSSTPIKQNCIIMDEVDGMDGNADRGGIADLISKIKNTKIPIICICNERYHAKLKSLAGNCFDLRFYKPRTDQMRKFLQKICNQESLKISCSLLDQVITSSNHDVRQCLFNLSMWSSNSRVLEDADIHRAIKDTRVGPFESCSQLFHANGQIEAKFDRFFDDYSLMPLFVYENYLNVSDKKSKNDFKLMSESIESMCVADRISRQIRTNNSWSLLPDQATFAVVVPGTLLALKDTVSIKFPAYLGKKSQHSRHFRGIQQMNIHTRLHAPMSLTELVVDHMSVLKRRLSDPLIKIGSSGISSVIKLMNDYGLSRSDFDLVLELCTFTHSKSSLPLPCISPKVKSAFTRTFNNNNKINSSHYKKSKSTIQKKDDLKEQKESDDDCDQEEERGSH